MARHSIQEFDFTRENAGMPLDQTPRKPLLQANILDLGTYPSQTEARAAKVAELRKAAKAMPEQAEDLNGQADRLESEPAHPWLMLSYVEIMKRAQMSPGEFLRFRNAFGTEFEAKKREAIAGGAKV